MTQSKLTPEILAAYFPGGARVKHGGLRKLVTAIHQGGAVKLEGEGNRRIEINAFTPLLLVRMETLSLDDWKAVFFAGFPEHTREALSQRLQVHKTRDVVRLYDHNHGWIGRLPALTAVSYSIPDMLFNTQGYAINQIACWHELFAKHADAWGLIDQDDSVQEASKNDYLTL